MERSIADCAVLGCVDALRSPTVLGGWAHEPGNAGPLDIKVYKGAALIGTGRASMMRGRAEDESPRGFRIELSEPTSLPDIRRGKIRAYALDSTGAPRELPLWKKLWPPPDPRVAVASANQLKAAIEYRGAHRWTWDFAVADALAFLDRDRLPVPQTLDREMYFRGDHAGYWLFGLEDYRRVMSCLSRYHIEARRVLDFGGSTGRVFRHFYCQGNFQAVYACDANPRNVEWCAAHFPPEVHVLVNSFEPRLTFENDFFDVVTPFSVFTHIDEGELEWVAEIVRVLRPGGLAYLTIHDETVWREHPPHLRRVLEVSECNATVDFEAPMPDEKVVFKRGRGQNVFLSRERIRSRWGQVFDVEEITACGHHFQTLVVARKRGGVITA